MDSEDNRSSKDIRGRQQGDSKPANSRASRRDDDDLSEEELYYELANINEKCDPMYFQSEIKRFGTGSIKDLDEEKELEEEAEPKRQPPRASQLVRRVTASSSKSSIKKYAFKKVAGVHEKFVFKRRLCRLMTLGFCVLFVVFYILTFFMLGTKSVILKLDWNDKDVVINMNNCRLFISPCDNQNCDGKSLHLHYYKSIRSVFNSKSTIQAGFNYTLDGNALMMNIDHVDDIRGCSLKMGILNTDILKSLSVNCNKSCVLIQQSGNLRSKSVNFKAEKMNLNILKLIAGSVQANISRGFFQVNDLDLVTLYGTSTATSTVHVGKGDIIVQSSSSLKVGFTSASENYCMAGKSTAIVTPATINSIGADLTVYVSQKDFEASRFTNEWTGVTAICNMSTSCLTEPILPEVKLVNFDGNIYLNVLDAIPGVVNDTYALFKSGKYGGAVDFANDDLDSIINVQNVTVQSNLPNLVIRFVFGNGDAWASHASHWVYVNHPIYSKIKPWWLSFFTLGKMVENTNDIQTYLTPGFCPYRHKLSKNNNFLISDALGRKLNLLMGVACFQKPSLEPLIPNTSDPSDGFQMFAEFSQFSDEWVKVLSVDGYNDIYQTVKLTDEMGPFLIMCLIIFLATVAALKMIFTFGNLLFISFQQVRQHLYQQELYWSVISKVASNQRKDALHFGIEDDDHERVHQQASVKNFQVKLSNSYFDLPSTMVYLDYLIVQLWSRRSSSIERFYNAAFERTPYDVTSDMDIRDLQKDRVPLKKLASLYQQMCFILNMEEADLTSQEHIGYLQERGMMLTYGDSHRYYLARLTMSSNADLSINYVKQEKRSTSLHIFLDKFCERTNFDEDMVPFDQFIERYALFCKLNHIEQVLIDLIILKSKFGIESRTLLKETIERDYDQLSTRDTYTVSNSFERFVMKLRNKCCKKSYYTLKMERAKNFNLFLAGKLNEPDIGKEEYRKVVELAVLNRGWWIRDSLAVLLEILLCYLLSIPLVSIFIFQEIEHSSYSLRSEDINIYGFNIDSSDIWLVPYKIRKNLILFVVVILFSIYWISVVFAMITNILKLEYPWIKSFDPNKTSGLTFDKILNAYQWGFTMVSIACYFWFIIVVVIWDILACILNPKAYLPSTGMAVAFLYMIYSIREDFAKVFWEKNNSLKSIYKKLWATRVISIMKKMASYLGKDGTSVNSFDYLKESSSQYSNLENTLSISEANLLKISEESIKYRNFVAFFFSLVKKNFNLRSDFEKMLIDAPFGFNRYTTQLLSNILFISKDLSVDKLAIEKNIKLCASVIFYYRSDIELSPLSLKAIPDLRRCDCPDRTLISMQNECSLCDSKGHDNYSSPAVKEGIIQARIEVNSSIMVDMLDILSSLQKGKTDHVVKIIEKLFIESYGKDKYEKIKPAFDILQFVVFNLVENYDYVKLARIFFNFLKRTVGVDMNLVEVLMLYLLKDNFIVSSDRYHVYNFLTTTSVFKRQIYGKGDFPKERKHLVRYLSLSTAFWSGEPQISDDLITEIHSEINNKNQQLFILPKNLIKEIVQFPLYMTRNQKSIDSRVARHSESSDVSQDISQMLYKFALLSKGVHSNKRDFEISMKKSRAFCAIKISLDIGFQELFGVVYLMKGDINNEYFECVIKFVLKRYNLSMNKKHLDNLVWLVASKDTHENLHAMEVFASWCLGNESIFVAVCTIMQYLKGSINDEDLIIVITAELFDFMHHNREETIDNLREMFIESVLKRNYSRFRNFKENIMYLNRPKMGAKTRKSDTDLTTLLDMIELLFEISCNTDMHEMLLKYKELVPEFEFTPFFNLSLNIIKMIGGFRNSSRDIVSERLKDSFNNLGEIVGGRPGDYEELWNLIYSSDTNTKLSSLSYFLDPRDQEGFKKDDRYKFHSNFIEKKTKYLQNQLKFISDFGKRSNNTTYQFSIMVIKRLFMPSASFETTEINMMLSNVATRLTEAAGSQSLSPHPTPDIRGGDFTSQLRNKVSPKIERKMDENEPDEQIFVENEDNRAFPIDNFKITRFYSALMDYIVNKESVQLSNYFQDDHDEPMLRILAFCKYCNSTNEVINKIFEQLISNGESKLCSLLYFFYIVVGVIQRRKINMKSDLELEITECIGVKSEFMEFIELYIDREPRNLVDMVFKIQSRIFYSLSAEKELQKSGAFEDPLMKRDFYENIVTLINEDQPSITFLSDLFRVPLKKMRFIYYLAKLKLNNKFEYISDNFTGNQDIVTILERRAINPQELVYLLKICLNVIDYDLITDFLRLMKLDQAIIPEILINLLLIDLKVEKEQITPREFNKTLLLHCAIFDMLGVSKELCWAFCRVLKGDFLIYRELIDVFIEDSIPENHKYFSSIMTGMVGMKNYRHFDQRMHNIVAISGLEKWIFLLNQHFSKYKKGLKENTMEYSLYLLHNCQNGFNLHPLWSLLVDIFSNKNLEMKENAEEIKIKRLPFLKNSNVLQFVALYNLVNADEILLEFLYDFAYFRNIHSYLQRTEASRPPLRIYDRLPDMLQQTSDICLEYKSYFRRMIKENRIVFDFGHLQSKQNPVFQGFLMDVCNTFEPVQDSEYYIKFNHLVFQRWKKDVDERLGQIDLSKEEEASLGRLSGKIEGLFTDKNSLMIDPFKMFVTYENMTSKDYWDRKFEELEYLDYFLDCLVEAFMDSLADFSGLVSKYKLAQANVYHDEPAGDKDVDLETSLQTLDGDDGLSNGSSDDGRERESRSKEPRLASEDNLFKINSYEGLNVEWLGLGVYSVLSKLRDYQNAISDDKFEKHNELLYRSNMLIGFLEKALYFSTTGLSFKRYMYLSEFNFSIGLRMPSKSWLKSGGSLFMPEIMLAASQKAGLASGLNSTDPAMVFFKCCTAIDIFGNDRAYFRNKGIFAQYTYDESQADAPIVDSFINLACVKLDTKAVSGIRKNAEREEDREIQLGFYTLQFWAAADYKDIHGDKRYQLIESKSNVKIGREDKARDSTFVSVGLILGNYYDFHFPDQQSLVERLNMLSETYFSKKLFKLDFSRMGREGRPEGNLTVSQPKTINYSINPKHLSFFNDLAIGKYSVLSETKNIFTDDIDLATYQKIYESILHLHSSKKRFDSTLLMNSLKTLSPYLSSNVHNLHSILEFVVEPSKANLSRSELDSLNDEKTDYYLFRELGLKNQSFFHIFLMHTYSKDVRTYL